MTTYHSRRAAGQCGMCGRAPEPERAICRARAASRATKRERCWSCDVLDGAPIWIRIESVDTEGRRLLPFCVDCYPSASAAYRAIADLDEQWAADDTRRKHRNQTQQTDPGISRGGAPVPPPVSVPSEIPSAGAEGILGARRASQTRNGRHPTAAGASHRAARTSHAPGPGQETAA